MNTKRQHVTQYVIILIRLNIYIYIYFFFFFSREELNVRTFDERHEKYITLIMPSPKKKNKRKKKEGPECNWNSCLSPGSPWTSPLASLYWKIHFILQIGFNVQLKDSKYKTWEQAFKMSPLSEIDYKSLTHRSAELSRTRSLHLSDGSSEWESKWASEIAVDSDNPFITLRVFMGY